MTVHMFRCFIGAGKMPTTDLETRIGDWVASNAEWVEDTADHILTERNTADDGTGETYYSIGVRFLQEDTKANVLQKFTDKLVNKVDWYRVGYHACEHDEKTVTHTQIEEPFIADVDSPATLEHEQITYPILVFDDSGSTLLSGEDYTIDAIAGTITAQPDGKMVDGTQYYINYEWRETPSLCGWSTAEGAEWTAKDATIPVGVPDFA